MAAPNALSAATSDNLPDRGERQLVRAIGTVGLAAGIVNITVGGGIFRLPANVAASLGTAAPLAYLVCAAAMGLIVLCFADAGSRVSLTGGPYAYIEVAFGPFVGFMSGVLLWLMATLAMAAVSTVFAAGIGELIPLFSSKSGSTAFLVLVFGFFALVNIRGVRQGNRANIVSTTAKLLPLLALVVLGAFAVHTENLRWQAPSAPATLARTSLLLIFAFSGVETALVPSGEVRDPSRTVPRAVLLAMVAITTLYVALQLVAQGILGHELASSQAAPLAAAAERALGTWGGMLLLVGASISMFGYVGGMTLAVPRALYAFARDGILPSALATVHPHFRTPYVAIAAQAAVVCALAASSTFERLAILSNISVLLLYGAGCIASWELRRRGIAQGGVPFRLPLARLVPWLACGVIVWMLVQTTRGEWAAVGLCLLVAAGVYAFARRRQ